MSIDPTFVPQHDSFRFRSLPPALAKLEMRSPSYGSLAQEVALAVGSSTRISPNFYRQNRQSSRRQVFEQEKLRRHDSRKAAPASIASFRFDDALAAAKRNASRKEGVERWRPDAVFDRVESRKKELVEEVQREEAAKPLAMRKLLPLKMLASSEAAAATLLPEGSTATFEKDSVCSSLSAEPTSPGTRNSRRSSVRCSTKSLKTYALAALAATGVEGGGSPLSPAKGSKDDAASDMSLQRLKKRFYRQWVDIEDTLGFDKQEGLTLFTIFMRARYVGDLELHKDELAAVTEVLGHRVIEGGAVQKVADDITPCSTLSFEQFLQFARRYSEFEKGWWQDKFNKYDTDGSGGISLDELRGLLEDLGYTPFRNMLREALTEVDNDQSGQISVDEFQALIANYRIMEGFTVQEYKELEALFNRFDRDKDGELDPEEQAYLKKYLGMKGSELGEGGQAARVQSQPIAWRAFLAEIRRCRELEVKTLRQEFDKSDEDGSGELDLLELPKVMEAMGWMPLKKRLKECILEVDEDGSGAVDFEEFVHMMWLYRQTEGFTEQERKNITKLFHKFDLDKSGEISVIELGDVLRHEGYTPDLAELQGISAEYDIDGNGDIGLREFLKIIRRYREEELKGFRQLFEKYDADGSGSMATQEVAKVLEEIGQPVTMDIVTKAVAEVDSNESGEVDWDEFVELMEKYRVMQVREKRKRCGYSQDRIASFLEAFRKYDSDHSDDIRGEELVQLLTDLNLAPRTQEEQAKIRSSLAECRESAEVEDGKTTFWVFIQLMRRLEDDQDRGSLAIEKKAAEDAGFSRPEVEEFRDIFHDWYKRLLELGEGTSRCGAVVDDKALTTQGISRILRSLGVSVSGNYPRLEEIVVECDINQNGAVDFPDFLLVMGRLMHDNFCNIKSAIGVESDP